MEVVNRTTKQRTSPERDEIYWTELEFRRLGNLVAQAIQLQNWVGDGPVAERERKKLRRFIDGMRRKALRILHRAELYAKSGHAAWPGLDPGVTDPVFMAEAYVKMVEEYENAFGEEEKRAKRVERERIEGEKWREGIEEVDKIEVVGGIDGDEDGDEIQGDLWTRDGDKERDDLLGSDGLRQRKKGGERMEDVKDDQVPEKVVDQYRSVVESQTSELLSLVGRLKSKSTAIGEQLENDNQVIDETDKALDSNLVGAGKQQADLASYTKRSSRSVWWALFAVCICLGLMAFLMVISKIPI